MKKSPKFSPEVRERAVRMLASVDAVAWQLMWVLLIRQVPGPAGLPWSAPS